MKINLLQEARFKIKKQYWLLFGMLALVSASTFGLTRLFNLVIPTDAFVAPLLPFVRTIITTIISGLILGPLTYGFAYTFMQISSLNEARFDMLFVGYKSYYEKSVGMYLLEHLYTFLWSLLLIIPGIIRAYAYSMSYYILIDQPALSADQAIKQSTDMMRGHKGKLFLLHLSLIPYYIPTVVLFIISVKALIQEDNTMFLIFFALTVIASLFVAPWMNTVNSDFYYRLKGEYVSSDGHTVRTENSNSFAI